MTVDFLLYLDPLSPHQLKKYEQMNTEKEQCMLHISVLKIIVTFGPGHEMLAAIPYK